MTNKMPDKHRKSNSPPHHHQDTDKNLLASWTVAQAVCACVLLKGVNCI